MNMRVLDKFEAKFEKADLPEFTPGDTIKVFVRVVEGEKVRQQMFQGVVISQRGSGTRSTFTVRKVTDGIGVERIFPVNSPFIDDIKVTKKGSVRRARIFYFRELTGKAARIKEKRAIS